MSFLILYALLALQDSTDVRVDSNLDYGGGTHKQRMLDVYIPKDAKDAPVIMFVHGGTWKMGDKKGAGNLGRGFGKKGFVVASVNYRLTPEVKHPGHIEDVAMAFAWLKKHVKDYGGNPAKIFVMGHSAGGHLVALLATNEKYLKKHDLSSKDIAGVIGVSGLYHVLPDSKSLPEVFTDQPETRKDASPADFVREGLPRFLLLYADKDIDALVPSAKQFQEALKGKKVESALFEIKDRDHGSIFGNLGRPEDESTKKILDFLK